MLADIGYCDICGDFLFNGLHRGNIEQWCRETKNSETENPNAVETKNHACETKNPSPGETKIRKRGRPRRETENPWTAAGLSRATWYRRMKGGGSHV